MQSLQSARSLLRVCDRERAAARCCCMLSLYNMVKALLSQQSGIRLDGDRERLGADCAVRGTEGVKTHITKIASVGGVK